MSDFCFKGAKEICEAVGENPKNIHELVREHGLPAWKRGARGTWRALPDYLRRWIREQRDRNMGHLSPLGEECGPSAGTYDKM